MDDAEQVDNNDNVKIIRIDFFSLQISWRFHGFIFTASHKLVDQILKYVLIFAQLHIGITTVEQYHLIVVLLELAGSLLLLLSHIDDLSSFFEKLEVVAL